MKVHRAIAEGSVLAFDFGLRRIGVAVGETIGRSARPIATVPAKDGQPDWLAIGKLFKTWEPVAVVVGMPQRSDGTAHELTPAVQRFMRQLHGRYGVSVDSVDESLSSHEAASRIAPHSNVLDAVAAQVILETWLSMVLA